MINSGQQLQVLESFHGFFIGTVTDEGDPASRESQYFPSRQSAENALASGVWMQRTAT